MCSVGKQTPPLEAARPAARLSFTSWAQDGHHVLPYLIDPNEACHSWPWVQRHRKTSLELEYCSDKHLPPRSSARLSADVNPNLGRPRPRVWASEYAGRHRASAQRNMHCSTPRESELLKSDNTHGEVMEDGGATQCLA